MSDGPFWFLRWIFGSKAGHHFKNHWPRQNILTAFRATDILVLMLWIVCLYIMKVKCMMVDFAWNDPWPAVRLRPVCGFFRAENMHAVMVNLWMNFFVWHKALQSFTPIGSYEIIARRTTCSPVMASSSITKARVEVRRLRNVFPHVFA